ncbi:hypothetical protein JCM10908_000549 [Rhodotorula pacifica]|uniref:uncharacterized protein n=1 Tax=Rhodotorula pacifica TaxID=1495444 RepID=UPI00317C9F0B
MSRRPFGDSKGLDDAPNSVYDPFSISSSTARPGGIKRSSSPSGLLGKIGLAQPSLHISLVEDVFFLHPTPEGMPSDDEFVRGTVTLYLPKARALKHLTVRLVGRYDIGWTDSTPYESGICLERTVSLLKEGEEVQLERGEHTFEFVLIVPAAAACYERCQYGRVRHMITAKAKGLGPMNSDILSKEKPTYLIVNPGLDDVSKPPPPMHHKFEGTLDEIGPYSMALQSQHCMVGGLLLFRLNLLFPPIDLVIYTIKVKIVQTFHLQSPVDKNHTADPPSAAQTVFIVDAAHPPNYGKVSDTTRTPKSEPQTPRIGPMKVLRKDEMWKLHHLSRLPNDNMIRPSTFEGTITPISVSHTIQMEMTYRPMTEDEINPPPPNGPSTSSKKGKEKEADRRKLVMSKPLELFSCCCFLDSLTLPVYSVLDPNPMPLESELLLPCVCGMTLRQLIESQANKLVLDDSDATIEYLAAPKPNDDQPPTPTSPTAPMRNLFISSPEPETPPLATPPLDDSERGRSASRRASPAATPPLSSGSRPQSSTGFFRVGSSSDRWFAMAGWRSPSVPGSQANSREGSRAPSRSASRQR